MSILVYTGVIGNTRYFSDKKFCTCQFLGNLTDIETQSDSYTLECAQNLTYVMKMSKFVKGVAQITNGKWIRKWRDSRENEGGSKILLKAILFIGN